MHCQPGGSAPIQSLISGDATAGHADCATRAFVDENKLKALAVMTRAAAAFRDILHREAGSGGSRGAGLARQQARGRAEIGNAAPRDRAGDGVLLRARIEAMAVEPMATDPAAFDAFFVRGALDRRGAAGRDDGAVGLVRQRLTNRMGYLTKG